MADTDTDTDTGAGAQPVGGSVVTGEHSGGKQPASIPGGGGYGAVIPIRTPERGRELANRRWELHRREAAAAVARRVGAVATAEDQAQLSDAPPARRGAVAYAILAGIQAESAYMDANPQAFRNVRQAIGADVGAPERGTADTGTGVGVDTAAARDLAEMLAAYRAWRDGRGDAARGG